MPSNEKKGITVKIDAELHAEVKQYLEKHEMTMAEFVTIALQDELHPKINITEEKSMGNMRTLAFQVPEELFQKIKNYLQRNNMTQKEFVIGLIEREIDRDLSQGQTESKTQNVSEDEIEEQEEREDVALESNFEEVSKEAEEYVEEQENGDVSEDFEAEEEEETEEMDEDLEETEEKTEYMDEELEEAEVEAEEFGMSMGM